MLKSLTFRLTKYMFKILTFRCTQTPLNLLKLVELVLHICLSYIKFKECNVKVYDRRTCQRTLNRPNAKKPNNLKTRFIWKDLKMMYTMNLCKKLFLGYFPYFHLQSFCIGVKHMNFKNLCSTSFQRRNFMAYLQIE